MSTSKIIETVIKRPSNFNMVGDGFRVYNYLPGAYNLREKISPFLMLDFNPEYDFGPSPLPRGVGVHPHKGFETVTIAYKGHVAHQDSKGNSGVIHPGDVQWMTAGAGILHKEFHETEFSRTGGPFEMVQLWVNLPRKDKATTAGYQGITSDQMGLYRLENNGGEVHAIAGEFKGTKGPAKTFTPINLFDMRLNEGAVIEFEIQATHNTALLVVEGAGEVNGKEYQTHDFILFKNEGENIQIKCKAKSTLLFLSGEPIHEPIVQYGPFVMNSMQEIHEAIDEFNSGKFGHLD